MMYGRYIVVTAGDAKVFSVKTTNKRLSDYGNETLRQELYADIWDNETTYQYTTMITEVIEEPEFQGRERDVLMFCAGRHGEAHIVTNDEYQKLLSEDYDEVQKYQEFNNRYTARDAADVV